MSVTMDERMREWIAGLPLLVLPLSIIAFSIAWAAGRAAPASAALVLLPMLAIPQAVVLGRGVLADRTASAFLLVALAGSAWLMGVQLLHPDALAAGWWRVVERAAALVAVLTVATARIPAVAGLRLMGLGAAVAAIAVLAINALLGLLASQSTDSFGTGHINILINTVGPSLLAWVVLEWRNGDHAHRRLRRIALGLGLVAVVVLALATGRRGIWLGWGTGLVALVLLHFGRRHAALAVAAAVALVLIGMAFAGWLVVTGDGIARNDRLLLWRAAGDGIATSWPCGLGGYGALHLQQVQGEWARHLTASGAFITHAHNEFLDLLLDGGIPALMLQLTLIVLLFLRIFRLVDPAVRAAFAAAGAAVVAHACTDNCYGTTIGLLWLAGLVGLVLAQPVVGTSQPWRLPVRFCVWVATAVAAIGGLLAVPMARLAYEAPAAQRLAALGATFEAQSVNFLASRTFNDPRFTLSAEQLRSGIDVAVARIGWTGKLPAQDARWALALAGPERQAEALLRILAVAPFDLPTWQALAALNERDPQVARLLPEVMKSRLTTLARGPLPAPAPPAHIDAAIDAWAGIRGGLASGQSWEAVAIPLAGLVGRYGDIPAIAVLTLEAIARAPATAPLFVPHTAIITWGCRFPGTVLPVLQLVRDRSAAQAVLPFVVHLQAAVRQRSRMRAPSDGSELGEMARVIDLAR